MLEFRFGLRHKWERKRKWGRKRESSCSNSNGCLRRAIHYITSQHSFRLNTCNHLNATHFLPSLRSRVRFVFYTFSPFRFSLRFALLRLFFLRSALGARSFLELQKICTHTAGARSRGSATKAIQQTGRLHRSERTKIKTNCENGVEVKEAITARNDEKFKWRAVSRASAVAAAAARSDKAR